MVVVEGVLILSTFAVESEGVVDGVLVSCCVLSPSSSHALSHTGLPPVVIRSRNALKFKPLICSAAEIAAKAAGEATNAVVVVAALPSVEDAAKGVFLCFAGVLVGGASLLNKEWWWAARVSRGGGDTKDCCCGCGGNEEEEEDDNDDDDDGGTAAGAGTKTGRAILVSTSSLSSTPSPPSSSYNVFETGKGTGRAVSPSPGIETLRGRPIEI